MKYAEADRYNTDKLRPTLIPAVVTLEVLRVLEMGAKKYSAYNWMKGLTYLSICDSMERHLLEIKMGQDRDGESQLLHGAHIIANAIFLCFFQINGRKELDDRGVYGKGLSMEDKQKGSKND